MTFLIDTHCHLDQYPGSKTVLAETLRSGVFTVAVTNRPIDFERLKAGFPDHAKVRLALGCHPLLAHQLQKAELELFSKNLSQTNYIGEVGLDFSRDGLPYKETQIKVFRSILERIGESKKLLTVHSRGAEKETLDCLKISGVKLAIFHWYLGSVKLMDAILDAGFYFSVNPAMIRNDRGKSLITKVPKVRLLTETDGPFVKTGGKSAVPADVSIVINMLSEVWQMDFKEVAQQIHSNLLALVA